MDSKVLDAHKQNIAAAVRGLAWGMAAESDAPAGTIVVRGVLECDRLGMSERYVRRAAKKHGFSEGLCWHEFALETRVRVVNWASEAHATWTLANLRTLYDWAADLVPDVASFGGSEEILSSVRMDLRDAPFTLAMGDAISQIELGAAYRRGVEALLLGFVPCCVFAKDDRATWAVVLGSAFHEP